MMKQFIQQESLLSQLPVLDPPVAKYKIQGYMAVCFNTPFFKSLNFAERLPLQLIFLKI